jgi:hypothetical protein
MDLPRLIKDLLDEWLVICECGDDMLPDTSSPENEVTFACYGCGNIVSMARKE